MSVASDCNSQRVSRSPLCSDQSRPPREAAVSPALTDQLITSVMPNTIAAFAKANSVTFSKAYCSQTTNR